MNGIMILSYFSGMLLYNKAINDNYGLQNYIEEQDPLQLSSSLYAIYNLSTNSSDDNGMVNITSVTLYYILFVV